MKEEWKGECRDCLVREREREREARERERERERERASEWLDRVLSGGDSLERAFEREGERKTGGRKQSFAKSEGKTIVRFCSCYTFKIRPRSVSYSLCRDRTLRSWSGMGSHFLPVFTGNPT